MSVASVKLLGNRITRQPHEATPRIKPTRPDVEQAAEAAGGSHPPRGTGRPSASPPVAGSPKALYIYTHTYLLVTAVDTLHQHQHVECLEDRLQMFNAWLQQQLQAGPVKVAATRPAWEPNLSVQGSVWQAYVGWGCDGNRRGGTIGADHWFENGGGDILAALRVFAVGLSHGYLMTMPSMSCLPFCGRQDVLHVPPR